MRFGFSSQNFGVRYGAIAGNKSPRGVSQIGSAMGNKAIDSGTRRLKSVESINGGKPPISVPLGNQLATNVGGGGAGAGRKLYGQSGSQSCYGSPAAGQPKPGNAGKDILREFGPDSAKR
jgi:hypothetical protein